MNPCPIPWCAVTTPHSMHLSKCKRPARPPVPGRWTIGLGQAGDHGEPHLNVIYLGQDPQADYDWHPSLADAAGWAAFASRCEQPELAAAITSAAALAGELSHV